METGMLVAFVAFGYWLYVLSICRLNAARKTLEEAREEQDRAEDTWRALSLVLEVREELREREGNEPWRG